jgi:large subunit ribosomal protein L20
MARVKRGTSATKRRKNTLKHTKGFCWGRKSKFKEAKQALMHAWTYAFRDRKTKKRNFRRLWQSRINSACREHDLSYSSFIDKLKKNEIILDRKVLNQISQENPETFKKIIESLE